SYIDETWQVSLSGNPTWTQVVTQGTPPSPRAYQAAFYDPFRDRMVVYGGESPGVHNDAWALSLSGTPTWTQLALGGTPPPARTHAAAVLDLRRDRMVLFGGFGGFDPIDTWIGTWDPSLASVPGMGRPRGVALAAPRPNPVSGDGVTLEFEL